METISIFFVTMSIIVLAYLVLRVRDKNRMPLMVELFYLVAYAFIIIIFLFPGILSWIEDVFGLASAINFFVYLSIFLGYLMIFILYQKTERQREQISILSREIALRDAHKNTKKNNNTKKVSRIRKAPR